MGIPNRARPGPVPGVLPLPALALPLTARIAITCDNFSPHLSTRKDAQAGTRAKASNVEIAYTPTNSSGGAAQRKKRQQAEAGKRLSALL